MLTNGITMRVMALSGQNEDLTRAALELRVNRQQYKDLRQSGSILRDYGMTRPLVAALDHDGMLTRLAGIPAVESLDIIPLSAKSPIQRAVVERLDVALACESQVVADWISGAADKLDGILGNLELTTSKLIEVAQALLDALTNTDVTITMDQVKAINVTATPADRADTCVTTFANALDALEPIDVAALLSDPEYRASCWDGLMDLCHSVERATLVDVDGDNDDITHGAGPVFDSGDPISLGYDPETLIEVLSDTIDYLKVVASVVDQKEEFISSIRDAADNTPDASIADEALTISEATADNAPVDTGAAVANVPQDGGAPDTNTDATGTDGAGTPDDGEDGSNDDDGAPDNGDVNITDYDADDHGEVVSKYACLLSGLITNGIKISVTVVAVADAYLAVANAADDNAA